MEEIKQTKTEGRYVAGNYTCDVAVRVIKKLESRNKMNKDGSIARTYGTWTKPDNFYYFRPSQITKLTAEDLKNPSLRQLIDNGAIRRTI